MKETHSSCLKPSGKTRSVGTRPIRQRHTGFYVLSQSLRVILGIGENEDRMFRKLEDALQLLAEVGVLVFHLSDPQMQGGAAP